MTDKNHCPVEYKIKEKEEPRYNRGFGRSYATMELHCVVMGNLQRKGLNERYFYSMSDKLELLLDIS